MSGLHQGSLAINEGGIGKFQAVTLLQAIFAARNHVIGSAHGPAHRASCPCRRNLGGRHVLRLYRVACRQPGSFRPRRGLSSGSDVFQRFFPWVWASVVLLLVQRLRHDLPLFGGFAGVGLFIHIMQGIGIAMMLLFLHLFFAPWRRFSRAVESEAFPRRLPTARSDPPHRRGQPYLGLRDDRRRRERPLLVSQPSRRKVRLLTPQRKVPDSRPLPGIAPSCVNRRQYGLERYASPRNKLVEFRIFVEAALSTFDMRNSAGIGWLWRKGP